MTARKRDVTLKCHCNTSTLCACILRLPSHDDKLVPITIACAEYDRTRAIKDGRVRVDGCEVTYLPLDPEELFFRAFRYHDFDVAELSFNSYLMTTSRDLCPYVAIPAFVSRHFRHSAIYIRTDRNIRGPADLKGKLVGLPEYQQTANVWMRGIFKEEYGIDPSDIHWRTGGQEEPGRDERTPLKLGGNIDLQPIAAGQDAEQDARRWRTRRGVQRPRNFRPSSIARPMSA